MSSTSLAVTKPKPMALVLMLGAFIGLFGETALNMALTNIMDDFVASTATVQWLTTGYLLVLGILVPVSALVLQWFTTRQITVAALILSILGTVVGGIAPNFTILLIGRVIQAIGTGLLLPLMMNVILVIFPIEKRGAVMGVMSLVITLAPAVGPTAAGFIVDVFSWHYIFWISLVFYVVLLVFGLSHIQNVSTVTRPKIDTISILLSTFGFGGMIFGLSMLAEASVTEISVYLPLLVGIVALLLFIWRQLVMAEPMVNLRVFQYRDFTLGAFLLFFGFILILSTAILLPLYLKGALLMTAAAAGLSMLPGNIFNALMAPIVGKRFDQVGPRAFLPIGFLMTVIAIAILVMTVDVQTPLWIIIGAYMLLFLGLSMIIMPAQTNGLNELPPRLYPHGAAAMNTLQQIAGAAGTAFAVTIMMSGQQGYAVLHPKSSPQVLLAAGTKHAFSFILGIAIVGFVLSLFVRNVRKGKQLDS
ncbi:MDR family MFS transporter [Brevibacillus reuszeri]|uniref:MDR family MFS transporter n=1 Tax=Brevibacillus reuszeri TaxID=54915 RepID=UPI0028A1A099|nr:MDR family MFS transporter [Brevibacillus reuszeri]